MPPQVLRTRLSPLAEVHAPLQQNANRQASYMTPTIRYTSFEQLRSKLLTAAEEGGRYEVA